jgi:hypothetical protein
MEYFKIFIIDLPKKKIDLEEIGLKNFNNAENN